MKMKKTLLSIAAVLLMSITCQAGKTLEVKRDGVQPENGGIPLSGDTIQVSSNPSATELQLTILNPNGVQVCKETYAWPVSSPRKCIDIPTIPDNYALVVRDNFGVIYYAIGIEF